MVTGEADNPVEAGSRKDIRTCPELVHSDLSERVEGLLFIYLS